MESKLFAGIELRSQVKQPLSESYTNSKLRGSTGTLVPESDVKVENAYAVNLSKHVRRR